MIRQHALVVGIGVIAAGLLLAALGAFSGPQWPPGPVAPEEPVQTPLHPDDAVAWDRDGFAFTAQARYRVTARVLGVRSYWGRDPQAPVLPLDVALGWGVMSDSTVLDQLEVWQARRWFNYRWTGAPPANPADMQRSAANVHLSPADETVADQLADIEEGDLVTLEGLLVNIQLPEGFVLRTSTSRGDSGAGACEIFWVTAVFRQEPS